MSVNTQIIIGRLGQDPESRSFPQGGSVCNFSVATTERYKDKQSGEQKEITTWHRVVLRNKLGEIAQQYLKKGSQVFIEGTTRHRKWQNQQGEDQYTTEIIGRNMTMLDSKGGNDSQQSTGGQKEQASNYASADEYFDDDIVF